jgi:hypothetical protein
MYRVQIPDLISDYFRVILTEYEKTIDVLISKYAILIH